MMSVADVACILQKGDPTPFVYEGALRFALRVERIRAGEGWEAADLEAAQMIQRALVSLNISRPTWKDGQPVSAQDANCASCGGPVTDTASIYCSLDCRDKLFAAQEKLKREAVIYRTCPGCGNKFHSWSWWQIYCSVPCHDKAGNVRRAAARRAARADKTCLECGKGLDAGRSDKKHCSKLCEGRWRRRQGPERPCLQCGAPFRTDKPEARFCCRRCQTLYRWRMKGDGPRHVRAGSAEAQGVLPGRLEEPIDEIVKMMPKRKAKRKSRPASRIISEAAD